MSIKRMKAVGDKRMLVDEADVGTARVLLPTSDEVQAVPPVGMVGVRVDSSGNLHTIVGSNAEVTVGQSEALSDYEAALAGASAGQVLTASGPGVAGFAAASGGTSLSDYANVVVVDAGGNGDYETVAEAMATANNGTVIFIFGDVVEDGFMEVTKKVTIIVYGSWTTAGSDDVGGIYIVDGADRAGELTIIGGTIVCDFISPSLVYNGSLSLIDVNLTLIDSPLSNLINNAIQIKSSQIQRPGANVIVIGGGPLYINSSVIKGGSTATNSSVLHSTGTVGTVNGSILNSIIEGTAATKQAIRFVAVQNGLYALNNRFIGNVTGATGFTGANFYNNVFQGTVTNLTGNSGTANGTNTVIS